MSIKITKKDVIWSYFSQIFKFGAGLFILPIILRTLTSDELGIWYVFLSVSGFVALLDFGFMPTIMRNVSYVFSGANELLKKGIVVEQNFNKKINYKLLYQLIKTSKHIYLIVSIIAIILLLTLGTYYIKDISSNLNNQSQIIIAWVIFIFSSIYNLYLSFYNPLLLGRGLIKETHKATVYSKLIYIIFGYITLHLGFGLIGIAFSNLISGLINRLLLVYYFYDKSIKSKLKVYKKTVFEKNNTFSILWHNSYRMGLVSFGSFLILRANTLLCSKFLDLKTTGEYGLSLQLITILIASSTVLFNTFLPKLNEARVKNDINSLKNIFCMTIVVTWIIYISGIIIIIFLSNHVLEMLGSQTRLLEKNMLLLMSLYLFLELNHSTFASFITTKNEVPFVVPALLSGFGIIILSIILLKFTNLGVWSLLISQFIVQLAYNNWKWPRDVMKDLQINLLDIIKLGSTTLLRKIKRA